ncbi:Group 4 capsule polysaccharide lipoprotein gfcB, YjbF [Loktanella fryxellensis]|uniref:Group 4 capsule polysaccharide lipoprotein gfcB, YjbF n=2 Tax=Loktanella fryxellensis TaxID=245187 RepID=A0A1H8GUS5_9RHOB|nr:Group 4 capsule polysaccharide lipoprotein gfcB, YjbF [Loktanella fryxellensis]
MGTVLAMILRLNMRLALLATLGALTLTACGPLNENSVAKGAATALQTRFAGGDAAAPAPVAPVLTRAQVDAAPGNFLVMNAYGGSLVAALAQGGSNGDRITWLSPQGLSVTTQNGVMVATRGFPRDLMAADVNGVMQALIASGGTTTRVHEVLSDTDQVQTQSFTCTLASQGRETIGILGRQIPTERFGEACRSDMLAFDNKYWIDDTGVMVRSLQAIAPDSGYIQLDRP